MGSKSEQTISKPPLLIFGIPFLTDVAGMLLIFAVGRSLAELGTSLAVLGLIGGGHSLFFSIASVISGSLSDRVGRARLIIPGVVLLIASAAVCAIQSTGPILYLAYWASAFGIGTIHPATTAWINSRVAASGARHSGAISSNLVRFCIAWNMGVLVAQLAGGRLFVLGASLPYLAAVLAASIDLVIVLLLAVRKYGQTDSSQIEGNQEESVGVVQDPSARLFVHLSRIANLGGAVAVSMMLHLFPDIAVSLDIPADVHGAILSAFRVVTIAIYILLHKTKFWHRRFTSSVSVQIVAIGGLMLIVVSRTPAHLLAGVCAVALLIGYNYFSGIYYGNAGLRDDRRGFATGMHEATLGIGITIGSAGGGVAGAEFGERVPYLLAAGFVFLLLAIQCVYFIRFRKRTR